VPSALRPLTSDLRPPAPSTFSFLLSPFLCYKRLLIPNPLAVQTPSPNPRPRHAFTLVEMLVVIGVISILLIAVVPAFNSINAARGVTRAMNQVSSALELARAEAMATRSYVYVGFVNTTNSDGNAELRCGAVISIDGSSDTTAANLRPVSKLLKLPSILMTNYTNLPASVKAATDVSIQTDSDYVISFPVTAYLKDKFNDSAFDSCPTVQISPQGEILHSLNPAVFFRTTTSVGLVPTHGTVPGTTDGAIVSYYGGTGQLRLTRPL
jgi:prepilin-type N-terminal cleavage/methylation domain-containing protein